MRNILYLLLGLCFYACTPLGKDEGWVPEIQLEGKMLLTDSLYMGKYFSFLIGNEMIMPSYLLDTLVYVGEIKGDSLITSSGFLSYGTGPNEMSGYFCLSKDDTDSTISVLDYNGGRLNFVYKIPLAKDKRYDKNLWKKYSFEKVTKYRCANPAFVQLSDSTLLLGAGTYDASYVLSIVNLKTQEVTPVDFWPLEDGVDCPNLVRQAMYMDNARLYRNGTKILYCCGSGHYAFIFELEGDKMVNKRTLFDVYPEYKVAPDGVNYHYTSGCNKALQVCVTQRFVYVRVKEYESRRATYKGYPYNYSDEIRVFDWEGNELKKYLLDIPCSFFIVDENDECMYTKTVDLKTDESQLMTYCLGRIE